MKKAILVLLALTAWTGCLEKETTQTLYIERDGSVTWEVLERNVHSSADKLDDRLREEGEYLKRALGGRPEIVEGLIDIGGTDVRAELLRDRSPFSLRATARFQDLEHALTGLFAAADIGADVQLEAVGDRRVLTITPTDLEMQSEQEGPVLELFRSDGFLFVVSVGEFQEANGFSIEQGGRLAAWSDSAEPVDGCFSLAWTVED
jgi:hypothetical protein